VNKTLKKNEQMLGKSEEYFAILACFVVKISALIWR
jgi:hypothetical protein